jgi:hypothetical protein
MTPFDPYYKWLAIPPSEQPPNLYRLLGVNLFEADPDVIEMAADQRMAHVRNFQTGQYSNLSQKILNELSSARVRLLSSEKRATYDEQLRLPLAGTALAPPLFPVVAAVAPPLAMASVIDEPADHAAESAGVNALDFLSSAEALPPRPRGVVVATAVSSRPAARRWSSSSLAMLLLLLAPAVGIAFTIIVARSIDVDDGDKQQATRSRTPLTSSAPPKTLGPPTETVASLPPNQAATNPPLITPKHENIVPVIARPFGDREFPQPPEKVGDEKPAPPLGLPIVPMNVVGPAKPEKPERPKDDDNPMPVVVEADSKHAEPINLTFDQDATRIQIPVGDIPKDAQLQIALIDPADKIVESKAKIRTTEHLLLNDEPRIEISLEVTKNKPGYGSVKVTPWLGNRVKGIPCNLTRLQQMANNLPGQIQDAQAAIEGVSSDLATWDEHLRSLLNESHGPPGADAAGQIQQQVAIREAKAKLTALRGRQGALGRSIDRWTAQVAELPNDIQIVKSLVGTTIKYRLFYVADGKEVEVGNK